MGTRPPSGTTLRRSTPNLLTALGSLPSLKTSRSVCFGPAPWAMNTGSSRTDWRSAIVRVDAAHSPAILTVFHITTAPGSRLLGHHELADDMERRARAMPGFVDFTTFTGDDGERVSKH